MKLINILDLRFPNKQKENEYMAIKREYSGRDFHITMFVLFMTVLSVLIERFVKGMNNSGYAALVILAIFSLLYIVRFVIKRTTQYLIVLLLFTYTIYRLVIMNWDFTYYSKANFFFAGYTYAVFSMALIGKLDYTSLRIVAVIMLFLLRYLIILLVINNSILSAGLLIRGILVDLFIIYYFHSREKTDRKVFLGFDQKREELLKFKELLADSLPLGITVVDRTALKPLFSNATFSQLFINLQQTMPNNSSINNQQNNIQRNEELEFAVSLDSFYGDENSIREIGKEQPELKASLMTNNYVCLKAIVKNLLQDSVLADKAICLTASCRDHENPRSFNVILKKIMWNGKDAIAVVLNDITYQEKLIYWKMANANKDKVIATVSHELRTPLNGILGLLGMAEKKIEQPEALEYISLCKDNAHLLLSLVNSMLDLHQLSAGKLKLNISSLDIRKCIKGVLQLFHFQTNQKGISLLFSVNDDVPETISTDENRLKQIIINLIGNAIKFTSQGEIKVVAENYEEDPSYLRISISDTGIGIKEEDRAKLFQMFGKLEDVEGVNKGGVGLGLTISNALAGMLSGRKEEREIQVVSKFGEGTTFTFLILKELKSHSLSGLKKTSEGIIEKKQHAPLDIERQLTSSLGKLMGSGCEEGLSQGLNETKNEDLASIQDIPSKVNKYLTIEKTTMCSLNRQNHPLKENLRESFVVDKQKNGNVPIIFSLTTPENLQKRKVYSMDNLAEKNLILIVDDNPFNLLVAENLVKETGYPVQTAMRGDQAIKKMQDFKKDGITVKAILMDCQMPVMDGYETSRILIEMMKKGEIDNVPIIAMTANNSEEDIQRCYESGMVGHLTKPASKNSLIEALLKLQ